MHLNEAIEYARAMKAGEASNLSRSAHADAVIREAHLAEHLPDDDEPITVKWLKEDRNNVFLGDSVIIPVNDDLAVFHDTHGVWVNGVILRNIKTRRQLRNLIKALKGDSQ